MLHCTHIQFKHFFYIVKLIERSFIVLLLKLFGSEKLIPPPLIHSRVGSAGTACVKAQKLEERGACVEPTAGC